MKQKKLTLGKFTVAKLTNMIQISGGSETQSDTITKPKTITTTLPTSLKTVTEEE